jgi:predicted permease
MPRIPGLRRTFRLPWRTGAQVARDVDEELAFHLDMRTQELVGEGVPPDAARAQARREFGDVEYTRRYCRTLDAAAERSTRRAERLDELAQDVRYALRQLRRSPGFALVAVLTLALGIGANTAIFSVVNGVLLRPLPFREPDRLVRVFSLDEGKRAAVSPLDFADWRDQARSFEGLAAVNALTLNLTGGGEPERLEGASVSAALFSVLGVRPIAGRTFAPSEDAPGAPRLVLLGEPLWRRRFGADPGLVGRTVLLDGEVYTVVGIVPAASAYPAGAEVWTPLDLSQEARSRGARYLRVIGRLAPGTAASAAGAEMAAIARRLEEQDPDHNTGFGAAVVPLHQQIVGEVRTPLLVLLGAVGFVLLIACANVANLLLARAIGREGELAVRAALGAGRGRIVRQLLTESLLLALLGSAAGVALAAAAMRAFVAAVPDDLPRVAEVGIDGTVLLATAGAALATGLLFGLAPALQASTPILVGTLKQGGRGASGHAGRRRASDALVVAEVALAVVLLAGAGLLTRSFTRLLEVDPGFRPERVTTFTVTLPPAKYGKDAQLQAFAAALVERLARLPGAQSAAVVSGLPLSDAGFSLSFTVDGRPAPDPGAEPSAQVRVATPAYFATMGIPLVRGRAFTERDRDGSPQVVVINREAARRFFPGEDPLGRRVQLGWTRDSVRMGGEIVGVVGDVRQFGLDAAPVPEIYAPYDQFPLDELSAVVRSTADEQDQAAVLAAVWGAVGELDRDLPVYALRTLEELVSESVARPRFYMLLLGAFAAVALLLSAVGIYGVMSYAVRQRTREIGIRVALGATGGRVLRMVLGQGLTLALAGAILGLLAALWVTRLMASLLYGVSPTDPPALAAGAVVLVAVAALACYLPARRAARADPLTAIRAD